MTQQLRCLKGLFKIVRNWHIKNKLDGHFVKLLSNLWNGGILFNEAFKKAFLVLLIGCKIRATCEADWTSRSWRSLAGRRCTSPHRCVGWQSSAWPSSQPSSNGQRDHLLALQNSRCLVGTFEMFLHLRSNHAHRLPMGLRNQRGHKCCRGSMKVVVYSVLLWLRKHGVVFLSMCVVCVCQSVCVCSKKEKTSCGLKESLYEIHLQHKRKEISRETEEQRLAVFFI